MFFFVGCGKGKREEASEQVAGGFSFLLRHIGGGGGRCEDVCRVEGGAALKTLTSLNKEVRPFSLSDNSIWRFPSFSSLSDSSNWRS